MAKQRDEATARLERLGKLLPIARELQDKMAAVLAECEEIFGGGAGIAAKLKQVETAYKAAWSSRYHGDYVFNYARDRAGLKRVLQKLTPDDLQTRMIRYLQDDTPAVIRERHPFQWFLSSVNRYTDQSESMRDVELKAPVADCRHSPRCTSDQAHTKLKMRELHG
jgi:hypothetical protein